MNPQVFPCRRCEELVRHPVMDTSIGPIISFSCPKCQSPIIPRPWGPVLPPSNDTPAPAPAAPPPARRRPRPNQRRRRQILPPAPAVPLRRRRRPPQRYGDWVHHDSIPEPERLPVAPSSSSSASAPAPTPAEWDEYFLRQRSILRRRNRNLRRLDDFLSLYGTNQSPEELEDNMENFNHFFPEEHYE